MFAIIESGGKQYKVIKDGLIDVEKVAVQPGKELILKNVLLAVKDDTVQIGQPYVMGAKVIAEVSQGIKTKKVIIFKYRRRKSSATRKGHRQQLSRLRIKDIKLG